MFPILVVFLWILPRLACSQPDPTASVSIDQLPEYSLQPHCGKGCLQNNYDAGIDIDKTLGCSLNGCFCGSTSSASRIVKSCWSAYCGQTAGLENNIQTALSIYNSYCGINAVTATTTTAIQSSVAAGATAAPSMSSTGGGISATPTTQNSSPNPNSDSTSAHASAQTTTSSTAGSSGLSKSDKIAIGVGLGVGIPPIVIALWMCCLQIRKR